MSRRVVLHLAVALALATSLLGTAIGPAGAAPRPVGASVSGTVTAEATGRPVGGITVGVYEYVPGRTLYFVGRRTTDSHGRYFVDHLPAGRYAVEFYGTDTLGAEWSLGGTSRTHLEPFTLQPGQQRVGVDAALGAPSHLGGRLTTSDGAPLAGVPVVVMVSDELDRDYPEVETDAAGRWSVTTHSTDGFMVYMRDAGPGYPARYLGTPDGLYPQTTRISVPVGTDVVVPGVLAATGSISGTLTRADTGAPLAGIAVSVTAPNDTNSVRTDADGRWRIDDVLPGSHSLSAAPTPDTLWLMQVPVEVRSGATTKNVALQARPAGSISGRIVDQSGQPLSDIRVIGGGQYDLRTDEDGRYHIGGLRPGDYPFQFEKAPDYAWQWWDHSDREGGAATVHLAEGENRTGVDATMLRGATVSGTVVLPTGSNQGWTTVWAMDGAETVGYASIAPGTDRRFSIDGLPPGTYTIRAEAIGWAATQWGQRYDGQQGRTVTVAASGAASGVDITMLVGGAIRGVVVTADGARVQRAVDVRPVAIPPASESYGEPSAPDGTFRRGALTPGRYRVVASCYPDEVSRPVLVDVGLAHDSVVTVTLDRGQGPMCYPIRAEQPRLRGVARVGRVLRIVPLVVHTPDILVSYVWWAGKVRLGTVGTRLPVRPGMRGKRIRVVAQLQRPPSDGVEMRPTLVGSKRTPVVR